MTSRAATPAPRGTYANRRRIGGERGRKLLRQRGELVERPFAHCLESGAMRRTWLRGHENILKRYLMHVAAFNLGLVMRAMLGVGTPRDLVSRLGAHIWGLVAAIVAVIGSTGYFGRTISIDPGRSRRAARPRLAIALSTGC